jgi:colanic acid biosynthesis glycosyl transferase WcaI
LKVLIVSQYFKPEDAKIPNGVAEQLAARGHTVRVLTGYPNYPAGEIFDGYRQSLARASIEDGLFVHRVPLFISHSSSAVGRIASYMSFAFSSLTAGRAARGADVVYVYATQMTAALAPFVWRYLRGTPYVLHIQDMWPESITDSSLVKSRIAKKAIAAILNPFLKAAYKKAAAVISIAPTMNELLIERGADARTTSVVLNWADEANVTPRADEKRTPGLTIVYAGNLGPLQDIDTSIRAAKLVEDLTDFRLIIVGAGIAEQELRTLAAGAVNVSFMGRVPISEMDPIYAESDFQLVSLQDLPIFRGTVPSKLQGSLAAGVPVIASVAGDAARLVEQAEVGLIATPEDAQSVAEAFRKAHTLSSRARHEMGLRARAYYEKSMSRDSGIDKIEQVLAEASKRHRKYGSQ